MKEPLIFPHRMPFRVGSLSIFFKRREQRERREIKYNKETSAYLSELCAFSVNRPMNYYSECRGRTIKHELCNVSMVITVLRVLKLLWSVVIS
jgi:hypothetical protein